ncbi:MAG: DUF4111 domain-containing protein [Bacillota bacterium]|nr:DUF4111 domain-containing protein [Bacillota bacterium]
MYNSIPIQLQQLFQFYVQLITYELGDVVYGIYIYGSVALGHFNEEKSDIDFMTFLNRDLTEDELKKLKGVHDKLNTISPYAEKLEGEYINVQDVRIGNYSREYPYFAYGKYQGVVGIKTFSLFQIKERGLKIYGEDFSTIVNEIEWFDIRNDLGERLNEYWIKKGKNPLILMFDGWISLIVLTLCRIYYILEKETVASKFDSAEFVIENVDEKYTLLIQEAMRIQQNTSSVSLFSSKLERKKITRQFVEYMVNTCNERFKLA